MEHLSCVIEYDKHGETKAAAVVEASHQGSCLCGLLCALRLAGVVECSVHQTLPYCT